MADASSLISTAQASSWIEKGTTCARAMLDLAGDAASRRPVVAQGVADGEPTPFGAFLLTWPEHRAEAEVIRHVADARFFLRLLERAYAPALTVRPDLRGVLADTSRCEVAFTNDVLQVQLRQVPSGYSMIRHHALMLFYGTLWLDPPARAHWFELYRAVAAAVVATSPLPGSALLDAVEQRAFHDFARLADRSIRDPDALLADLPTVAPTLDYLRWAAVAVAAVEHDYARTAPAERTAWHRAQLRDEYVRPDYSLAQLERLWRSGEARRP